MAWAAVSHGATRGGTVAGGGEGIWAQRGVGPKRRYPDVITNP